MYGPNSDNPNFFKQISSHIDNIHNTDIIICGDYNCVLNPELDYYNYKGINNAKARETVLEIINDKYLITVINQVFGLIGLCIFNIQRLICRPVKLYHFFGKIYFDHVMKKIQVFWTDRS